MTGLILAGTSDARELCSALANFKVPAIASLAGETRNPVKLDLPMRIGGFGGKNGLAQYLTDNQIKWVVDATHPFASQMTQTNADVCLNQDIPFIGLQRPAWEPASSDKWHFIDTISELAGMIPDKSTVFLGTGRKTLSEFTVLKNCKLLCRVIDAPVRDFPFPNGQYLVGRPPFSVEEEIDLFKQEKVDWLVVKNSGGSGGFAKLAAARGLGLPVAMIQRQTLPQMTVKSDVQQALDWIQSQLK